MALLTAKTSTVFIASGGSTRVYRSVDEVPPKLRKKLQQSVRGLNSATILIADKRGREELVRALQGQASSVQCRLMNSIRARQAVQANKQVRAGKQFRLRSLRTWLELLLPVAVGATLWFFVESRF